MSFDIFTSSLVWPAFTEHINATWLFYLVLFILLSIVMVLAAYTEYYYYVHRDKGRLKRNVSVGFITSAILVTALSGLSYLLSFERTVTNIDEVKTSIQQEYGIELTDESIENLYETRGNRYKEYQYVADVEGQIHPYTIVGDSFYLIGEPSK